MLWDFSRRVPVLAVQIDPFNWESRFGNSGIRFNDGRKEPVRNRVPEAVSESIVV